MPLVKLLRPALIAGRVQPKGHVFQCDRRQLEHYTQGKMPAGVEVPVGTESDVEPDLETTKAERPVERATRR